VLNGVATATSWVLIEASTTPTANNLVVSGTPAQGNTLTSSYTFAGGNGVEDLSLTGTSFVWQTASDIYGNGVTNAPYYNNAVAYTNTYLPQSNLIGKFIRVAVRVKDGNGLQSSVSVNSPWVGPIAAAVETAPSATGVIYSPAPGENLLLTLSYTYFDSNFDPEATPVFQWYRSNNANGSNAVAIPSANSNTYLGVNSDAGSYIGVGVTPKAASGIITGTEVRYFNSNTVSLAAAFTFTASNPKQFPFYSANRTMDIQNGIQVEINVTAAGSIRFTSPTVNGYYFSFNTIVSSTGTQWITIIPTGIQSSYNSSGDNVTVTGIGQTNQTKSFTINNTRTGNDFSSYFNGIVAEFNSSPGSLSFSNGETFNTNNTCKDSPISAGYTSGTCTGSVSVGSNSYALVLINGQCWMQTNLKEIPSAFPSYTTTSQLAGSVNDVGYWGYYNTTTTAGTAGWQATEPAAGEGLLYQWSAAMNGSTLERSQGVCPTGFHVPSDCEWMYLEHGQGMSISQQNVSGTSNRVGTNASIVGNKLRSTTAGAGTNTTGFSGLINGIRDNVGVFLNRASRGYIWSSTTNTSGTIGRNLLTGNAGIYRAYYSSHGLSVRCLKD
jgi:uncharacterized protein (TIGR02145 family)